MFKWGGCGLGDESEFERVFVCFERCVKDTEFVKFFMRGESEIVEDVVM